MLENMAFEYTYLEDNETIALCLLIYFIDGRDYIHASECNK